MGISHILVFTIFALITGWLVPQRYRMWVLMTASLVSIYWLQPSTPIRNLDFWLPSASIGLTLFVWGITTHRANSTSKSNRAASIFVLMVVILVGLLRYSGPLCCITPSRPPDIIPIVSAILITAAITAIPFYIAPSKRFFYILGIGLILVLFIIVKSEPVSQSTSAWLRSLTGQSPELASIVDIPWLGFSYLAFRLLHVLRDKQQKRLSNYSLGEFVTYALFFSTYTAGPIDRVQRFVGDLRNPVLTSVNEGAINTNRTLSVPKPDYGNYTQGGKRILMGTFKKFVIADSLALIALNAQNATEVKTSFWAWVLLYAYALRIFFDFDGYTDIALGLGRLVGIKLPENFDRPYFKQNITAFWNSWHITLAQWFRAYYFNPLTRYLRTSPLHPPMWLIIMIGQVSTMVLIGLWHGLSWNFAIWGIWHGVGLFIHNRWSNWTRPRLDTMEMKPIFSHILKTSSWFLTFNFVSLGWVWFVMPTMDLSLITFQKLAGF